MAVGGTGLTVMVNVIGSPVQPVPGLIKLPIEMGYEPTFTVEITAFDPVLRIDTLFDFWFTA